MRGYVIKNKETQGSLVGLALHLLLGDLAIGLHRVGDNLSLD
jgi:hypothetical protein